MKWKRERRTWKPERLFLDDYWRLTQEKIEFFTAICALVGSTRGCEQGFNRSFGGERWSKISLLYEHFLQAAQRKALSVQGSLSAYPIKASELSPAIERKLLCQVQFRDLVHVCLLEKIALPWELQSAFGTYQFFPHPAEAISVSITRDQRSTGGKCIVSGISFPPDFEIQTDLLTNPDRAAVLVQAAASVLLYLDRSITKRAVLHKKIEKLPLIGEVFGRFWGEHTFRDWLKPVLISQRGRPIENTPLQSKRLEFPLDQTLPLYLPLAREIELYLARLKTAVWAMAVTLASESTLSEEEICKHELIQQLLEPVSISIQHSDKKLELSQKWILEAVKQVQNK